MGEIALVGGVGLLFFNFDSLFNNILLTLLGTTICIAGGFSILASNRASERENAAIRANTPTFILRYNDGTAVQVGDRVAYRRIFSFRQHELLGRVAYVPGQCAQHPEMKEDGCICYWGVSFDNGTFMAMVYDPRDWLIKRFRFIERGDAEQFRLRPETELL